MQLFGEYGPFFEVGLHHAPPPAPWSPVSTLAESRAVTERVAAVRQSLNTSARVAGSVAQLSLVARLIAPALACSVRYRRLIGLTGWYWQGSLHSTFSLSIPDDPTPGSPLSGTIRDLTERLTAVPARSATGNIASAINTATLLIGRAAYPYAEQLLAELATEPGPIGFSFRRNSCCLLYQADRPICADCVLGGRVSG